MLSQPLKTTLEEVTVYLDQTHDPWWILGSAAVALKGYDPGEVRDIDVLVSLSDAARLMQHWGSLDEVDGGTANYRSQHFLKPALGPVPVEIMAGYEICEKGRWLSVWPMTRDAIKIGSTTLFVPGDEELISIFRRLGRDKDFDRINAMTAV